MKVNEFRGNVFDKMKNNIRGFDENMIDKQISINKILVQVLKEIYDRCYNIINKKYKTLKDNPKVVEEGIISHMQQSWENMDDFKSISHVELRNKLINSDCILNKLSYIYTYMFTHIKLKYLL